MYSYYKLKPRMIGSTITLEPRTWKWQVFPKLHGVTTVITPCDCQTWRCKWTLLSPLFCRWKIIVGLPPAAAEWPDPALHQLYSMEESWHWSV